MIQKESLYNLSSIFVLFGWKNWCCWMVKPILGESIVFLGLGLRKFWSLFGASNETFWGQYFVKFFPIPSMLLYGIDIFKTVQISPQLEFISRIYA